MTAAALVAASGVFFAVFGVFVAAVLVLTAVTIRWAVKRDRVGRSEWLQRQRERAEQVERATPVAPPRTNGSGPHPSARPRRQRKPRR